MIAELPQPAIKRCRRCGLPHGQKRLDGELCGPCRVEELDEVTMQIPRETLAECAALHRRLLAEKGLVK